MTVGVRARLSRLAAGLTLLVAAFGVGSVLAATGAAAATITCTSPNTSSSCRQVTPQAACLWDNGDGTVSVAWSYDNDSSNTVIYHTGTYNDVSPGASDQGQPTKFLPGQHNNVFVTTNTWLSLASWRIGNETDYAAWWATTRCSSKPVSQLGSPAAVLVAIVGVGVVLSTLALVRGRRQGVSA